MKRGLHLVLVSFLVTMVCLTNLTPLWAQTASDETDSPSQMTLYLPLITMNDATDLDFAGDAVPPDSEVEVVSEDMVMVSATTAVAIDTTQDAKGLGYPDSRKLGRQRTTEHLFAAYRKKVGSVYRIFVAKSTDNGATWPLVNNGQPIDPATNFTQRVPSIAVAYSDALHVVWYGADNSSATECDHQIRYRRSRDGGNTWEDGGSLPRIAGYNLGSASCTNDSPLWQEHPMIYAVGETILIVWEGRIPCSPSPCTPAPRIKFIKSTDGGNSWSSIQTLPDLDGRSFSRPTFVAAGDQQSLYVFAYATINNKAQIVWIKSTDLGNTWSAGWRYIRNDTQDQRHVSVAIDSIDRLHVVWRQKPSGAAYARIRYALLDTLNPNATWNVQWMSAAKSSNHQFFPTVAVDGSDRVWIAWSEVGSDPTGKAYGFPNEEPYVGNIYSAMLTSSGSWQKSLHTNSGKALYPVLRYQRYGRRALVDLVWLEGSGTATCPTAGCTIQYSRLAGQ